MFKRMVKLVGVPVEPRGQVRPIMSETELFAKELEVMIDCPGIARYLRDNNMSVEDLTEEQIERLKLLE